MAAARRYFAFDALRAGAMELGLVLHAAVPYTRSCPDSWVACDPARSGTFDLLNTLIHAVRMPVFFLMSGFFAALLLERVGAAEFVRHRLRRIGLPLVVGCAVLVPLTRTIWIYGAFARSLDPIVGSFPASLRAHFENEGWRIFETIWHLWFLEYLLILTAGYLVLRWIFEQLRFPEAAILDRVSGWLVSPFRVLVLAIPTILVMWTMKGWNVDGIGEIVPAPHMLAYYAIFFSAGVLLFRRRDDIEGLRQAWRPQLVVAALALVGMMMLVRMHGTQGEMAPWIDGLGRTLSGLLTCLLLYGFVGLFVEVFDRDSARQRYAADAAYFVYLTHFPLIALLGVWMGHLPGPAGVKFLMVLAVAVPTLLTIYQFGVRYGPIGRVLHGPRTRRITNAGDGVVSN